MLQSNYKNRIYITTCEDIGAIIQVEITTEDSSLGTAIGKIGPFRLDRSVRKALELIICKGFGKFPLICSGELDYDNASDLLLEVEKDQLRLQTFSKNGEIDLRNSFTTAYSVTYPKILLNKSDCTKLSFVMNDGNTELSEQDLAYNRKLLVNCLTQQTRDLIVMTIRVFALKNSIKIDRLLEADLEEIGKRHTDAYLELGSIMQEMNVLQDENFLLRDENLNQKKQINSRKSPESIEKLQEKLRKSNESKERLRLKYSQKRIETEELQAIIEGLKESESALSEKLIA